MSLGWKSLLESCRCGGGGGGGGGVSLCAQQQQMEPRLDATLHMRFVTLAVLQIALHYVLIRRRGRSLY